MRYEGVASINFAYVYTSGEKWKGARCGGRRSEGQVCERGRASVVIWGRCISRIRRVERGLGVSIGLMSVVTDDDDCRAPSSLSLSE